jgi:hypothetical protein
MLGSFMGSLSTIHMFRPSLEPYVSELSTISTFSFPHQKVLSSLRDAGT